MATIDLGKIKFKWQGTYAGGTAYVPDDVVYYMDGSVGSSYMCKTATQGNAPSSGGTPHASWEYLAKGQATSPTTTQGDLIVRGASADARLAIGTAGQALKVNSSANGLEYGAGGGVVQTKSVTKTDTQQIGQAFADVTGLSVNLTMSSSSNKVLVTIHLNCSNNAYSAARIVRVTSGSANDLCIGDAAASRTRATMAWQLDSDAYEIKSMSNTFLDTPGAGTHTYKIQVGNPHDSSYYATINYASSDGNGAYVSRTASTLTVQEVLP